MHAMITTTLSPTAPRSARAPRARWWTRLATAAVILLLSAAPVPASPDATADVTDTAAADAWEYYHIPVERLEFESPSTLGDLDARQRSWRVRWMEIDWGAAYIESTPDLEGFVLGTGWNPAPLLQSNVHLRVRRGAPLQATMVVPAGDDGTPQRVPFSWRADLVQMAPAEVVRNSSPAGWRAQMDTPVDAVPEGEAAQGATDPANRAIARTEAQQREGAYWSVRSRVFRALQDSGVVGGPYYRHQAWRSDARARALLGEGIGPASGQTAWETRRELGDYDLFTGGRALRENLQLDRTLQVAVEGRDAGAADRTPFDKIPGVEVKPMDWSELLPDKSAVTPDALAAWIPEDQHAAFFPTFTAFVTVSDEAHRQGETPLRMIEPRSEHAMTKQFYEDQLALPLSELARQFGPAMVRGVAITGSDPYLREGSDVALLFDCKVAAGVEQYVKLRHAEAIAAGKGKAFSQEIAGHAVTGVISPRRDVSSLLVRAGDVTIVSNSLAQLGRCIAANATGKHLSASEDYLFFRQRYAATGAHSALIVLTDATIRRWVGPRWRILEHRRASTGAVLNEYLASRLAARDPHAPPAPSEPFDLASRIGGDWGVDDDGRPFESIAGTPDFLTPIIELPSDGATAVERSAYDVFRNQYQTYWRRFFDPIGVGVEISPTRLALDTTIMPIIAGSDYREFVELTGGPGLSTHARPPDPKAVAEWIMQLNPEAPSIKRMNQMSVGFLPGSGQTPLKWLGRHVRIALHDHPSFWTELADAEDKDDYLEHHWWELPVSVEIEVVDPLALTLMLTSVRALALGAVPDLLTWEPRTTPDERSYVAIMVDLREALRHDEKVPEQAGLYYIASSKFLMISLREDIVLARLAADAATAATAAAGAATESAPSGWLGENVAVHIRGDSLQTALRLFSEEIYRTMERRCFANMHLMNEWHRLGEGDPVAFHLDTWGTRLVCPAGGTYAWDADTAMMQCSLMGNAHAPRTAQRLPMPLQGTIRGAAGLTFEHDGLRARVEIDRTPATE